MRPKTEKVAVHKLFIMTIQMCVQVGQHSYTTTASKSFWKIYIEKRTHQVAAAAS